jgi:hypothetical protein
MDLRADLGDFDQFLRCGTDPAEDERRRRRPTHRQRLFVGHTAGIFRAGFSGLRERDRQRVHPTFISAVLIAMKIPPMSFLMESSLLKCSKTCATRSSIWCLLVES